MECPKCGYDMDDLDSTCPRCAAAGPAGPGGWQAWEQQAVDWLISQSDVDAEKARRALAACSWNAPAALAVLRGAAPPPPPPPLPGQSPTSPAKGGPSAWVIAGIVGLVVLVPLAASVSLFMGLAVRNAGQRAKSARKAEDVRAINEACWLYENDTGRVAAKVGDLTQDPSRAPRGYNGPYLRGDPTDPFSGAGYTITDGTVTGPGDVVTFMN